LGGVKVKLDLILLFPLWEWGLNLRAFLSSGSLWDSILVFKVIGLKVVGLMKVKVKREIELGTRFALFKVMRLLRVMFTNLSGSW
jgi:hypothetical protein